MRYFLAILAVALIAATPMEEWQAARNAADTVSAYLDTQKPKPQYPTVEPGVPSDLVVADYLGPQRIPASAKPDVVGAFRFLCGPGQLSYDDPIVWPGQPGKAHLHQFFGNLSANGNSTYASLRKNGDSTCMNSLNRSAYWMPAMLDGKGNVVRPDFVSIYYKRHPSTDPFCIANQCAGIPQGLRLVFGWDQTRPNVAQPENQTFQWKCISKSNTLLGPVTNNLIEPAKVCVPGSAIYGVISTPHCWDGKNLDSPDHRSHLSDMKRDGSTNWVAKCPPTHPRLIPQFTMQAVYSVVAGDDPTKWMLSSDHMLPDNLRKPGLSFHSDYFEGWEPAVRLRWEAACIDKLLNCSDGDLGDGSIMKRGKYYPGSKDIGPRLVPVPVG